jgi:integrase
VEKTDIIDQVAEKLSRRSTREPSRERILSNAEVKRLLDNARSSRDKAIFLTMLQNGVSLSTIRSLKYEDVMEDLSTKSGS